MAGSKGLYLNVMVVDDSSITTELLRHVLREMEFGDIKIFGTARRALQYLKFSDPDYFDLVISDWNMPEMNGIEFLKEFRKDFPDTPFLMLTGNATKELVLEAISAGVTEFVAKPFRSGELKEKVQEVLDDKLSADFSSE